MAKCRYCKYCYCSDSSDVSGLNCRQSPIIKITELDNIHFLCRGFKFSLLKFLFGLWA